MMTVKGTVVFGPKLSTITNGLVLYLDAANSNSYSGTGSTWYDISGLNNNATLVNNPTFSATNNGIFTFNGTNTYGTIPYTIQSQFANQITICAWVNLSWFDSGNGDGVEIIAKDTPTLASPYTIYNLGISNSGLPISSLGNGISRIQLSASKAISLNTWIYLCTTYDGSILKMYINGVQDINTMSGTYTIGQNTVPLTIGSNQTLGSYYDWFKGSIGSIMMYNRALSPTEVLFNYNVTKTRFGLI